MLQALVQGFDRDAAVSRQLIRDLLDNDRQSFYSSAIDILRSQDDSRGAQHLIALLVANDLLLPALCDPALSREQAVALARAAVQVDSMADVTLAKRMAESAVSGGSSVHMADVPRLMEILGEISDGTRILPSLMRLLRHSNPHLRSKAVLMIGRGSRSVKWVRKRLAEPDPRVRANAIEALWGVDTEEARGLLHFAMYDKNNRVAGNALIGLYWLGDCTMIPDTLKMASHESSLFRSTAAWVMGETGDPRFTEVLAGMLREPNTAVRKRAFAALGQIKAATAQTFEGSQWRVAARYLGSDTRKGLRRLQLAVTSQDCLEHPKIRPTQFLLSEGGQHVVTYKVEGRPVPEAMSVVFVLPRAGEPSSAPWNQAALHCLAWKRPSDLWATVPYIPEGDPGTPNQPPDSVPPRFTSKPEVLEAAFSHPPNRAGCTDLWNAIWRSARPDQGHGRGRRHLIVFSQSEIRRSAGPELVASILGSRTSVQVVCSVPNSSLADFCRRTKGSLRMAGNDEEVRAVIENGCLSLLSRYDISYQAVSPEASHLKVRVHAPSAWGETSLPIPAPA
jgi:hypothetical protein